MRADLPTQQDPRLITMYYADWVWNAVTTTRSGRIFVGFPPADLPGISVEDLSNDGGQSSRRACARRSRYGLGAKCGCGRPMIHINKGSNRDNVQRYLVCDAVRRGLEWTTPGSRWWPYLSTEFAILGCVIAEGIAPLDSDAHRYNCRSARTAGARSGTA